MACLCAFLLFLTLCVCFSSAVTHTLEYKCTADTLGQFTAVGLLDGEEFMYYNIKTENMTPKTNWIKEVESNSYWQKETRYVYSQQDWLKKKLLELNSLKQGVNTLQRVYGCEIDDNDVTRGYDKSIYNGKDFIRLNLDTRTWTAVDERAQRFTEGWNPAQRPAGFWKNFLEGMCVDCLKRYMPHSTKKKEPGGAEERLDGEPGKEPDEEPDKGLEGWQIVLTVLVYCYLFFFLLLELSSIISARFTVRRRND